LNEDGSQLFFTAIDGSKWLINTNTLLATANETEESSTDKNLSFIESTNQIKQRGN
jgi:hypothetical protein